MYLWFFIFYEGWGSHYVMTTAQGKNIHKSISRTAFEPESPYKVAGKELQHD